MSDKKKNFFIIALSIAVVLMSVGYAALAHALNINGTANTSAKWDIDITNIQVKSQDGVINKVSPSFTDKTVNFNVILEYPGANSIYIVTIENKGTIDAILSSVTGLDEINAKEPLEIKYTVTPLSSDDILKVGESKQFEVKVEWINNNISSGVKVSNKIASINFNYVQNQ